MKNTFPIFLVVVLANFIFGSGSNFEEYAGDELTPYNEETGMSQINSVGSAFTVNLMSDVIL